MRPPFPPLALALAACLMVLGGCRDKHAPSKPTVAASIAGQALCGTVALRTG